MKTYLGAINLQKYLDSLIVNYEGDDGIFIPFKHNPSIYVGKKGIYANIVVKELETDNYGNTHMICATLKKETLDTMSESEKKLMTPILGNLHESLVAPHVEKAEPKKFNDTSVLDKYSDCDDLPL